MKAKSKLNIIKIEKFIISHGGDRFLKLTYMSNEFPKNKISSHISLVQHYICGHVFFFLRFEHE